MNRQTSWLKGVIIASFLVSNLVLMVPLASAVTTTNYNFGAQNVTKGASSGEINRNNEDAIYQTITELDQYANTNFTGSSESVTTGTAGGGSFPSALTTDDASRRSYQEANTASETPTYQLLRPTSDGDTTTMVEYPTSPTTHYDKVDETTAGGDGDTTYLEGVTNSQESEVGMGDMSDPGGSYNIDVTMWQISRGESTSSCTVVWGVEVGGTEYQGGSTSMTTTTYTNYSYEWTTDPSDSNEWTLSDVNGLECYVRVTDANPDTRTTQIGLLIEITPAASYELLATITYSSVTSSSQTTGYAVFCQGYRSGAENFWVQAWDYTGLSWTTKTTIQAASDTEYDFTLATTERDSTNDEVKLRIVDASGGEVTQDTVYFDVLKVTRIEVGYALDVDMTASSLPVKGDLWLRIKGYTSSENIEIKLWTWGSSSWSSTVITVTALTNTWYTYNFTEGTYLSSGQVKIDIVDSTAASSDQAQDVFYLDVAWVTHYTQDPYLTNDAVYPSTGPEETSFVFTVTFTDPDNHMPSGGYPKVWIEGTSYTMSENTSETDTWDGKDYHYDKGDFTAGDYDFYFIGKCSESGEVVTTGKVLTVTAAENHVPTLTLGSSDSPNELYQYPDTQTFWVTYTDEENNPPLYVNVVIDGISANETMQKITPGDTDYTDGCAYVVNFGWPEYYNLVTGDWAYHFQTQSSTGNTEVVIGQNGVYTVTEESSDLNTPFISNYASFPGSISPPFYIDTPMIFIINITEPDGCIDRGECYWREDNGTTQNISMDFQPPYKSRALTEYGQYYTPSEMYFARGTHWYDFGQWLWNTSEVYPDQSFTILNREPVIEGGPISQHLAREAAWSYDFNGSDGDYDDELTWGRSGADWLTITSGGYLSGSTDIPGTYSVTVYLNDSHSGQDTWPFTIWVDNQNPVITSSGNTTQHWMTYFSYEVDAFDPENDIPLTIEVWTNASFLALDGWYLNGTADTVGWYDIHLWVNDSYGGSDIEDWVLTVTENQAPYFTTEGKTKGTNGTAWEWTPTVIDPDDWPEPLEFTLLTNASWMQIDSVTGRVNGTPTAPGIFYYNITADDGNKSTYLNTTLTITEVAEVNEVGILIILALGLSTLVMGFYRFPFLVFSGFIWIFGALMVFYQVGAGYLVIGLGLGLICLTEGGLKIVQAEKARLP